ncbi:MAG: MBL fold metallo-hydrolase [Fimbriimonadaceae bacterium]
MPEVIVLGSGTSSGVPVLGVTYPPSFLANPKNHRTRPSILIQGPTGNLLVDCAPDMRTQLLREKIDMVDAVIITHSHADHIMGMDDLRSFCLRSQADMQIFTLPQYAADIRRIFSYAFEDFPPGIEVPRFALNELGAVPVKLELCGLTVKVMLVWHGKWPVLALRVNNFAYVTDVKTIPTESWEMLQGLDTLILDAVRLKPHPNHLHFEEALEVAKQLGAKQTYFNHLSHDFDHDVTNHELPENIQLSFDGQRILI